MNSLEIMKISSIVPVIALDNENDALPLAEALTLGGINIMEITLRTKAGLKAIELLSKKIPHIHVGAGTVCNKEDIKNSIDAGAKFIFSPGISTELIQESKVKKITLIPGVSTASEIMLAKNAGIKECKLFPATAVGGVQFLKAISGPFADISFCPTGGINQNNFKEFLNLKNVLCVGGSWIVPASEIKNKNFKEITKLCKTALNQLKPAWIK